MSVLSVFLLQIVWCAVLLVITDLIWLTLTRNLWQSQVFDIQRQPLQIRPSGAVLAYVALILAILIFAVQPAKTSREALWRGTVLGFCLYAVFDGTTLALFSKYRWSMAILDVVWGTFLCGFAAGVVHLSTNNIVEKQKS